MALSMFLTLLGAALLYGVGAPSARAESAWQQALRRHRAWARAAGASALVAGALAGVSAEGWGIGLTVAATSLMLALSLLALCHPLWPRRTWGVVQVLALVLVVKWLGGA
ncbi:hypothetical protein [Vitiosangium sp. GDMCC 1.1324]|uniref:hypothetical protein n=1 Tax=Vitiosangium sp. (strain GDMCC 1.1324) TaxID=2138576 RepID=UPI000D3D1D47|nr:hypothetical protein [Vitiosangium sp. GDMCC 1.1324]PTL84458.1 hypothetical protein DAT35_05045 [Vitiosangium sp. GDMCC 1.1324]